MKRARLIIKEITVSKAGEIKNFQIRLPKNVTRVIAIETDLSTIPLETANPDQGGGTKI